MAEPAQDFDRWVADARAGSREALGRVLEACRRYLLLVAERQIGPDLRAKGGASDLVQETFLEAQRDFAQFHGVTEEELLAWLRCLLVHNAGNFTRRYRKTDKRAVKREVALQANESSQSPNLNPPAAEPSPSSQAAQHEMAEGLRRALERLQEDYRLVIVYRYLEERSFEEIGQLMDRSPDAARKLWARAMERLRHEWEGLS